MKIMKKMSALLLAVCLSISCFSFVAYAADGRISFTDPETAVGEMVEVKCVTRSTSGNIGNIEIKLTYDSESLRFDSGEGVTDDGNGELTYTGTGSSSEVSFTVTFQALKEGTANVGISSATVTSSSGTTLDLEKGQSAVTIAEGDPSKIQDVSSTSTAEDIQVDVDGVTYTLTDSFADADIPSGYARTQVSLDGQERQMVTNESSGIILGYLLDEEEIGDFFIYNEENATFAPYEEVAISDTTSIIILNDTSSVNLPDTYLEAKMTLNGKEFPVWQDSENVGYYILYAMNNMGETGYYQYDSEENTYQRFIVPQEEQTDSSSAGKLQDFLENHLRLFVLIVGLGIIFALIIIIVLAVKLRHRNLELDDLYDEYGIDLDEEEDEEDEDEFEEPVEEKKRSSRKVSAKTAALPKNKKSAGKGKKAAKALEQDGPAIRKPVKKVRIEEEEDFDNFAPLDEEDFDNFEGYFSDMDFDDAGYDESNDFIEDTSELLSNHPEKKRGHAEVDDTFRMDIIDLD